jgi:hypothetical protein
MHDAVDAWDIRQGQTFASIVESLEVNQVLGKVDETNITTIAC